MSFFASYRMQSILLRSMQLGLVFGVLSHPWFAQGQHRALTALRSHSTGLLPRSTEPAPAVQGLVARSAIVPAYRAIFPQIAIGGPWATVLVLMNLKDTNVEFTLSFYKGQGAPWRISFVDGQKRYEGVSFTITLAAHQSKFLELSDQANETQSGYAVMVTERWAATGYAIFRAKIPNRPDFEAVVPAESLKARCQFAFDNTNNFVTSIALTVPVLPPYNNAADIFADVYDENGILLQTYQIHFDSGEHRAVELPSLLPITANRRGVVKLSTPKSTDGLYSGLVLLFNPTGAVTTAPMIDTDML